MTFTTADLRAEAEDRAFTVAEMSAMLLWAADLLDAHRKENDQLRDRAIEDHQFIVGLKDKITKAADRIEQLEATTGDRCTCPIDAVYAYCEMHGPMAKIRRREVPK